VTGPARDDWVDFRIGFQPGFNGFRGVGILTFLLYHAQVANYGKVNTALVPGAFLWLDMFFVQSGFLIVSLLLEESYRTGRISLRGFWVRRAARLFPALGAVCLVVAGLLALRLGPVEPGRAAWGQLFATLGYVNNWYGLLTDQPPFLYLEHGWSLSVEEQFYLVAPVATILVITAGVRLRTVVAGLVVLASASAGWMAFLAARVDDDRRLYYATDTRAQAFFVGVALAFAAAGGLFVAGPRLRRLVRLGGWAAVPVVCVLLQGAALTDRRVYSGVFLLGSVCFAAMMAAMVQEPDGLLNRALAWRPMASVGKVAYGLYLWHWPVFLLLVHYLPWRGPGMILLQITAALAVAGASWRYLEAPVLARVHRARIDRESRPDGRPGTTRLGDTRLGRPPGARRAGGTDRPGAPSGPPGPPR